MKDGVLMPPLPRSEPIRSYLPGTSDLENLLDTIQKAYKKKICIPMHIGGQEVFTEKLRDIRPPHRLSVAIAEFSEGSAVHVHQAIQAALKAKPAWESMPWPERAAIFLRAAELIAGPYRHDMNAATMLGQSKNIYQSEIDCICELVDFLRFNVYFMSEIYRIQPLSVENIWNTMDYRPLEGFVFALTPFNFTAIAGNLPTSVAMMGNVVVWKPAHTQIYAANLFMKILVEAGLPKGVINLVYTGGKETGEVIFKHPDFAGLHFTGSTKVFTELSKEIAANLDIYKSYPRIVGETGGKDFILVAPDANLDIARSAIIRGSFEYQGQKCSASSRIYVAKSLWPALKDGILADVASIKVGPVEDYNNFVNAVIDEKAFDNIVSYIEAAREHPDCSIIAGGTYNKANGYFIDPTVIHTSNPRVRSMQEEIFGPVTTIYVYDDRDLEDVLDLIDGTSNYALTGAVIAQDRRLINTVSARLRHAAGNFYINDKCTGAVVGQQPFGGARKSGTNDKAGSILNLLRWVSPRTIKESFAIQRGFKYPYMD